MSERFRLIPLRYRLFTPELQWQSRGKRRISQGCNLETPGPGDIWVVKFTVYPSSECVPPHQPDRASPIDHASPMLPWFTGLLAGESQQSRSGTVQDFSHLPAMNWLGVFATRWHDGEAWGLDTPTWLVKAVPRCFILPLSIPAVHP